jgi:hypothetical protein
MFTICSSVNRPLRIALLAAWAGAIFSGFPWAAKGQAGHL